MTRWLTPDDDLRVGRGSGADLSLDDGNRFLHRRLIRLWCDDKNIWRVSNEGSRVAFRVCDSESAAQHTVAPQGDAQIGYSEATVRVLIAQHSYLLSLLHAEHPERGSVMFADQGFPSAAADDPPTFTRSSTQPNIAAHGDQLRLLLALTESTLLDPHATPTIPTRAGIGHRFGWTTKAVDRKLDKLCERFAKLGVEGLRGELGLNATDRMANLARFAIDAGIVRSADLVNLETYD